MKKSAKKQLHKKKIKSLSFKLKVYRTATALGVLFVNFQRLSCISAGNERENLGIFMKTYNDHTDIGKYPGEKVEDVKNVSDDRFTIKLSKEYEITYLPKGFKMTNMNKDEAGWSADYYKDADMISFKQKSIEGGDIGIDTENTQKSYVDINGHKALVNEKKNDKVISIVWRQDESVISIICINVNKDEVIKNC